MRLGKALLVVDMQNDFCPGGALGVPGGDRIVPLINRYLRIFSKAKLAIFVSRDWHPKETAHFKKSGGIWPRHCVAGTKGARFHPKLKLPKGAILLYKGMSPSEDSYSVFQARDKEGTDFGVLLEKFGIKELYMAGLATDYCVKFSSQDALRQGLKVAILIDAVKGVNLKAGDSQKALATMRKEGAREITFNEAKMELS